jgi:hypothetical protein
VGGLQRCVLHQHHHHKLCNHTDSLLF